MIALIIIVSILIIIVIVLFILVFRVTNTANSAKYSISKMHKEFEMTTCRHDIRIDIIKQYKIGNGDINTDVYFMCTECDLEYNMNVEELKEGSEEKNLLDKFIPLQK